MTNLVPWCPMTGTCDPAFSISTTTPPSAVTWDLRRRSSLCRGISTGRISVDRSRKRVRNCETCQRVKSAPALRAPLHPPPLPPDVWSSVSMNFVFGLPPDRQKRAGVVVFVDLLSKMVHLASVRATVTAEATAKIFLGVMFRHHRSPGNIVSDRDPRLMSAFWPRLFELLGTRLSMSTASSATSCTVTRRRCSLGVTSARWPSSRSTTQFTLRRACRRSSSCLRATHVFRGC